MHATSLLVVVDVHNAKFRILPQGATWWQNENIAGRCFHASCVILYLVSHLNIDGMAVAFFLLCQLNVDDSTCPFRHQ